MSESGHSKLCSYLQGDVLIQIADNQRRLALELEGVVNDVNVDQITSLVTSQAFFPCFVDSKGNCVHLFPVPQLQFGSSAGDGEQHPAGHRLHLSE